MNGRLDQDTQQLRKFRLIALLVYLALFVSVPAFADSREYQIKAEFLERFTRFIEWPAVSSIPNQHQSFFVCVIGKNPYGPYLKELAAVVKIQKKQIQLSEISSIQQIQGCNLLFIGAAQEAPLSQILEYTHDKPILTVSDSPGFAEEGVLINFYDAEGYVRFEINTAAVQKSGLKFSSRLLKLGRLVDSSKTKTGKS